MTRRNATVAALCLVSVVSSGWNLAGEYPLLGARPALVYWLLWIAAPALCALVALLAAGDAVRKTALTLLVCECAIMLLYALNGPSSGRGLGAQHMHVVAVPLLFILLTVMTLPVTYVIAAREQRS